MYAANNFIFDKSCLVAGTWFDKIIYPTQFYFIFPIEILLAFYLFLFLFLRSIAEEKKKRNIVPEHNIYKNIYAMIMNSNCHKNENIYI